VIRSVSSAFLFLCLCSLTTFAQSDSRVDLFGGYSYLSADTNGLTSRQSANGFEASASVNLKKWIAAEGDVSGYFKTYNIDLTSLGLGTVDVGVHDWAFAGGPRFKYRPVFAHALIGVDRLTFSAEGVSVSQNAFAAAFGGGLQWKFTTHWGIRGSGDYVLTRHNIFGGDRFTQNNFRASVGLVYSFGSLGGTHHAKSTPETVAVPAPNAASSALAITRLGLRATTEDGGAKVVEVAPTSLAEQAGLKPGDVINRLDDAPVRSAAELSTMLSGKAAGAQIRLGYMVRGLWQSEKTLTLP
jgi:hypothetical protein